MLNKILSTISPGGLGRMKREGNWHLWLLILSIVFTAVVSQGGGGAYLRNRGNDALDLLDVGVTVTSAG